MTFSYAPLTCSILSSLRIKDDFLVSFAALENIESQLPSYQNGDPRLPIIVQNLVNVTKIYNQNVEYINNEINSAKFPEFPSLEAYCTSRSFNPSSFHTSKELAATTYQCDRISYGIDQHRQKSELTQLKQIGFLCNPLSQKITRVFEQLRKFESIATQIPVYQLQQPNLMPDWFAPQLRIIEDASITPYLTIAAEISEPTPILPPTINITLACHVGSENALGICCEPDWGTAPIAFTKNENGWSGQVPVDKEWKCVILQNDQVVRWENANNRRCDAETQPFTLSVTFG